MCDVYTKQNLATGKSPCEMGIIVCSLSKFTTVRFSAFFLDHGHIFQVPDGVKAQKIRINFIDSTDFFGRITIYTLDVL